MRKETKWGRWVVALIALGGVGFALFNVFIDNIPRGDAQKIKDYVPWDEETVELVESFPVQDGGRVKPFSTYAAFKMLGLHGARSMKIEGKDGKIYKLKPTEWLMDTLFRPHLAVDLPTFRIDNSKVLEAIGVEQKGRRDRYSYREIVDGLDKLVKLAESYESIDKKKRDPMQQQSIDLAYNIRNYEVLLSYFGFVRNRIVLRGSGVDGKPDTIVDFSKVMMGAPEIRRGIAEMEQSGEEIGTGMQSLLEQVLDGANYSRHGLFMLPPKKAGDEDWLSAGNAIMSVMTMESPDPATAIDDVKMLETTVHALSHDEKEFRKQFSELKKNIEDRAYSRGELSHVSMEVSYFKRDYFLNAMVLFLIGSLCALGMWGMGRGKIAKGFYWGTFGFTTVAVSLCVIAIVMRCIIMQRPPVGNLYDTIVFIAATSVILALLIEWMSKKTFALGLAPILGTALILLARRYEVGDAKDHLDPLVAVLDSNYWLTTHVITITLGYSAGLLAAMLSCIYVLMRALNLDEGNKELRRSFTKAVYGSICLTVFLSLVGTVLGGIWANDSWGRFWGWDPKENGALMIVLWTLAILHARLGGIIKEWGLHLASMFTACIVAFSWWHVNFLDTGLHSYGFTADKKSTVFIFYGVIMLFILLGATAMLVEKISKLGETAKKEKAVQGRVREA